MGCSFNNIPEYREAQLERKNDLLTQENAKLQQELAKTLRKIKYLEKRNN